MIILNPIETNILLEDIRRITFWLALLQIPRLLFKLMKAIGTTCIGMDRHCN